MCYINTKQNLFIYLNNTKQELGFKPIKILTIKRQKNKRRNERREKDQLNQQIFAQPQKLIPKSLTNSNSFFKLYLKKKKKKENPEKNHNQRFKIQIQKNFSIELYLH